MKNFIVGIILLVLFNLSVCQAKELSPDQKAYFSKLRVCEQYQDSFRIIYGIEGNYCKVGMILPPMSSNSKSMIWVSKYPRSILNSLVNDSMTLSDADLKAKWEKKLERYFVSVDWK